jgi:hypothetical protein
MPNVVIATTMWGQINKEKGLQREDELLRTFWGDMRDGGCRVERFEDTYDSAWRIIGSLEKGRAEAENKRRAQETKGRMAEIKEDLRKTAHEERKKRKGISALSHKLFGGSKRAELRGVPPPVSTGNDGPKPRQHRGLHSADEPTTATEGIRKPSDLSLSAKDGQSR